MTLRFLSSPARLLASVLMVSALAGPVIAQDAVNYTVGPDSKLWIEGTSNRSDFTVQANELSGTFSVTGEGADVAVRHARVSVAASSLKGGKSTIMDRLMYDALNVSEHPAIRYELASATAGSTPLQFSTNGKLTLAGETRDVVMEVQAQPVAGGKMRFTGSYALKMSDYGIEAPTAMFGSLRTSDNVTVHFDIVAVPAQ